jgi:hypothetical protein
MKRNAAILACVIGLSGCATKVDTRVDKAKVEAGLQQYSRLLLSMDSTGIAAMFAPDGEVTNPSQPPVKGRAEIQKFIASFADFHVLSNTDIATSTLIDGNTAEQLGAPMSRAFARPRGISSRFPAASRSNGSRTRQVTGRSCSWRRSRLSNSTTGTPGRLATNLSPAKQSI